MKRGKAAGKFLGWCIIIAVAGYVLTRCVEIIFGVTLW